MAAGLKSDKEPYHVTENGYNLYVKYSKFLQFKRLSNTSVPSPHLYDLAGSEIMEDQNNLNNFHTSALSSSILRV